MNTFQVALVYNRGTSFVFFFYDETVTGFRAINAGFSPSSSVGSSRRPFNVPGVFTNSVNLISGSNTGVPGFYAFRVDLPEFISQPGGMCTTFY